MAVSLVGIPGCWRFYAFTDGKSQLDAGGERVHRPHVIVELKNYTVSGSRIDGFTNEFQGFEKEGFQVSEINSYVLVHLKAKSIKPLSSAPDNASHIFMLHHSRKPSIVRPDSTVIQYVIEKKEKNCKKIQVTNTFL
jgi:hypothetical protein